MARYTAWITDAESANEGQYTFEAKDDLFDETPVRIVRSFMEYVDRDIFPRAHVDYEINAALKHGEHKVVTAMGSFLLDHGGPGIPFTLFIAAER